MELALVLLTAAANLFLGVLVYLKNPRSATHYLLTFITLILAAWSIANYFSLNSSTASTTLFWIRLVMFITSPLSPAIFLFLLAFPRKELKINLGIIAIGLLSVLVGVLSLTPLVFSQVDLSKGVHPVSGPGIILWGLLTVSCLIAGFATAIRKYLTSQGLVKLQLRYLAFGAVLTFGIEILTNFFAVVIFNQSASVIFGPPASLILVSAITYAIVKHRLLDIRLVMARTVAYTLLVAIVGALFVGVTFILSSLLLNINLKFGELLIYSLLSIFIAAIFESLRNALENFTDKIFFKGHYNLDQLLSQLSSVMSGSIELSPLATQILTLLVSQMRVRSGVFIILEGSTIYDIFFTGLTQKPFISPADLIDLTAGPETKVQEELTEGDLKELMRRREWGIVKLLKVKNEIVGILILGEKETGEVYSIQDFQLLDIFAPQAAIAIQNSQSFDKIRRFNIILKQEVDKATSDLKLANTKLEELDQLKDDFVSVASHELRTPMTAIRSYAWMALHRSDVPLSDKLKKYLNRTLISTERLINLVNDMLNISRIESGRIEILPEVFDIRTLVDEVLIEVGPKAAEKKLNLRVYSSQIPKVYADVDKVHQILLNLIGNAMKFTPNEGDVTVSFFSDGFTVDVSVKDSGVGITREDLSRLFKKFGRLDNSYVAAATSGGTGLGLYISKSLVDRMGGRIWAVSSGLSKGSTFTFSLPIATKEVLTHAEKYSNKVAENQVKYLEPVAI